MGPFARRPRSLSIVIVVLNIAGIFWIHHDLTGGSAPRLRVVSALPARDVDLTDRFGLVFEDAVVPASMVGSPLVDSPFAVVPPIAGQWTWAAPDKLEYRLDAPLPPGRRFTVRASSSLERVTGRRLLGESEFHFETRPLKLESCHVAATDSRHVTLELRFNQPVNPADLLQNLKVTDAQAVMLQDLRVLTQEPSGKLSIRAARPTSGAVHVHIAGRLTGNGGDLPLGDDIKDVRELNPRFVLLRSEIETPEFAESITARLHFSRVLDAHQTLPPVRVSPDVSGLETRVNDQALVMEGQFKSGQRYTATVSGNLLAHGGEALGQDATATFEVPDHRPQVRFAAGNGILSPRGSLALDLSVVNLAGLQIKTARVHANNLIGHLRGEHRRVTARELPVKTIPLNVARNEPAFLALDLRELLGQPLGVYSIRAEATDRVWTSDQLVVAITDLGITAKAERGSYVVWVTSLAGAHPLPGVEITAVSFNNQILSTGRTDAQGLARLALRTSHPDGPVYAIIASHGEDLSFLRPEDQAWPLDDLKDLGGRSTPQNYDVLLYPERGVYRPGDGIHLTGIIRDTLGGTPQPFPLTVTVRRPDDRVVAELPVRPDPLAQGFFQVDYLTHDDGHLGPYRFTVALPGSNEVLGRTQALVEEFVPARLQLQAEPTLPRFGLTASAGIRVSARYLFDQPAAGLALMLSGQYRREVFHSARYPEFCFEELPDERTRPVQESQHRLDARGRAEFSIEPPTGPPGLWSADLNLTVHEEGGRSVSTTTAFTKDTAGRYVGVRLPAGRIIPIATPVDVNWVQVTGSDQPTDAGPLSFTLNRADVETSLERVDDRYVWKTTEHLTHISDGEISRPPGTQGAGQFTIACPASGHYRLEVVDCEIQRTTRLEFDVVAPGQIESTELAGTPEHLQIRFDQETYSPGTSARLLIDAPFPGTMLLTIEAERVLYERVVSMTTTHADVDIPVDAQIRGGAFVVATLVRPVDPTQKTWLPHRATGIARLRTECKAHELPVALIAPKRAEPGEHMEVQIRTTSPADPQHPGLVHLWAVDEGILMTTGYRTPNPIAHFFAPRKLEVTSADVFDDLLPDYARPAGMVRIGGDGAGEEEELRRSPVSSPRREPIVVWRQVMPLAADGTLTVALDLPRTTGELRLMAVVVDGDRCGSSQQALTLTSPLLVETSCPRFVAPGDRFLIPVKVFNTTDAAVDATLSMGMNGPVTLDSDPHQLVSVRPDEPAVVWCRAQSTGLGQVKHITTATAQTAGRLLRAESTCEFFVRPAGPLFTDVQILRTKAGEPLNIPAADLFIPGTARTNITVSANPTVNLLPVVDQLLDYPYGCVEQTTGQLYALLYAPELVRAEAGSSNRSAAIKEMIQAGIMRLWSMQTRSGGLSYWPGSREPDLWGTTYAAGFLAEAQRAGHPIDARFLKEMSHYLQEELAGHRDEQPDDNLRAEICHTLAVLKAAPLGWVTRLAEHVDQLDTSARAHLAGAWLELGRKDRAMQMLPHEYTASTTPRSTSGRLSSAVQSDAVLLRVLLDLDAEHAWIPLIVQRLEKARQAGAWGSTLENAAALAAMAKYQLRTSVPAVFQGVIRTANSTPAPFSSGAPESVRYDADVPIAVESTGQGDVSVCVTRQGLLREPVKEFDRSLQVSRRWTDRQGKPVDPSSLHVGDLVFVETTLAAPSLPNDETVDNIALVDALPGGMEIENPRLITSDQRSTEVAGADRVEFRDDRVVIFSSAARMKRSFRYALRAMTAGSFELPNIEASCMYDAGFASLHGHGRVEIAR